MEKQPIKKSYKTGENPEIGDLVWRLWESTAEVRDYGIVVDLALNSRGTWLFPIIYWASKSRSHRSLTSTVRLVARAK